MLQENNGHWKRYQNCFNTKLSQQTWHWMLKTFIVVLFYICSHTVTSHKTDWWKSTTQITILMKCCCEYNKCEWNFVCDEMWLCRDSFTKKASGYLAVSSVDRTIFLIESTSSKTLLQWGLRIIQENNDISPERQMETEFEKCNFSVLLVSLTIFHTPLCSGMEAVIHKLLGLQLCKRGD